MLIYVIEPSINGLLSAFYLCCKEKRVPARIAYSDWIEVGLEDEVVSVASDEEKSRRILDWLENTCGRQKINLLFTAFDSGRADKCEVILRLLLCVYKYGVKAFEMKNLQAVAEFDRICAQVAYEVERLCGFVRFRAVNEIVSSSGRAFELLYAVYRSDNDVLDRVAGYFAERNNGIPFVLHDGGREKAALYNGERIITVPLKGKVDLVVGEDEALFSSMFKRYFDTVSVSTRKNSRLQRAFLPLRYRDAMTEFQPEPLFGETVQKVHKKITNANVGTSYSDKERF